MLGVAGALVDHAVEVRVFVYAYYFVHRTDGWGKLQRNLEGTLLDCLYFSFTMYTTVGDKDIEPIGLLRYLIGIESLTGLVLITWTASFLYYEMQRYWDNN